MNSPLPIFTADQVLKISRSMSISSLSLRNCRAVSGPPSAKEATEGAVSSSVDTTRSRAGKRERKSLSNCRAEEWPSGFIQEAFNDSEVGPTLDPRSGSRPYGAAQPELQEVPPSAVAFGNPSAVAFAVSSSSGASCGRPRSHILKAAQRPLKVWWSVHA